MSAKATCATCFGAKGATDIGTVRADASFLQASDASTPHQVTNDPRDCHRRRFDAARTRTRHLDAFLQVLQLRRGIYRHAMRHGMRLALPPMRQQETVARLAEERGLGNNKGRGTVAKAYCGCTGVQYTVASRFLGTEAKWCEEMTAGRKTDRQLSCRSPVGAGGGRRGHGTDG